MVDEIWPQTADEILTCLEKGYVLIGGLSGGDNVQLVMKDGIKQVEYKEYLYEGNFAPPTYRPLDQVRSDKGDIIAWGWRAMLQDHP